MDPEGGTRGPRQAHQGRSRLEVRGADVPDVARRLHRGTSRPPRAQLAANLLLDSLVQAHELAEVREVADTMLADREFIDGKPDLLRNIALLRTM